MSTHTTVAVLPVTRAQAAEYMLLFANRTRLFAPEPLPKQEIWALLLLQSL